MCVVLCFGQDRVLSRNCGRGLWIDSPSGFRRTENVTHSKNYWAERRVIDTGDEPNSRSSLRFEYVITGMRQAQRVPFPMRVDERGGPNTRQSREPVPMATTMHRDVSSACLEHRYVTAAGPGAFGAK